MSRWPRKLHLNRALASTGKSRPDLVDRVAGRLGHFSQFGLLLLAIVGYFYTVVPIYQKSVLEEEIAKKQVQLKDAQQELDARRSELAKAVADIEKAYQHVRRYEIGQFVFQAGADCSGLYRPPRELRPIGAPRAPRVSPVQEVLDLPVQDCLKTHLDRQLAKEELRPNDRTLLEDRVGTAIKSILGKREEVRRKFNALRPELEKQRDDVKQRISDLGAAAFASAEGSKAFFALIEEERQVSRRELDLAGEYTGHIRREMLKLRDSFVERSAGR